MKVLHVITTMDRGGAENHVATLARAQAEMGHEVRIMYLSGTGEAVPADVIALRSSARNMSEWFRARRWVGGNGIVHAHLPRAELAATQLLSSSAPIVISRHNTEPFWNVPLSAGSRWLSRQSAARADTIIAISKAVESYHRASGHLTSKTRIEVIHYGYEVQQAPLVGDSDSKRHAANCQVLRVACIARLTEQKDLPTLLLATRMLIDEGIDVEVRIAGDGPQRSALELLIDRLRLRENVNLVGRIPNPEEFIADADIFALPSKYEGLGLVLLEAMGVGTAIVAARNTAITEVVVDEHTGLLFSTGDPTDLAAQVRRLALNPDLRRTLAAAGAERLRSHYSVDRMLQQTMSVYEGALERAI